jgi:hypothetical protein
VVSASQVLQAAIDQKRLAASEQQNLMEMDALFPPEEIVRRLQVPAFGGDVHGVESLLRVAAHLCAPPAGTEV